MNPSGAITPEAVKLNEGRVSMKGGADQRDELAARRHILFRLPAGRALDHEDLVSMLDEGNQTWRAIQMRTRLLDQVRRALPGGILVTPLEIEQARAAEQQDPARYRDRLKMAEWPSTS